MKNVKRKLARILASIDSVQDYMCTMEGSPRRLLYETVDVCVNDARLALEDALDAIDHEDRIARETQSRGAIL